MSSYEEGIVVLKNWRERLQGTSSGCCQWPCPMYIMNMVWDALDGWLDLVVIVADEIARSLQDQQCRHTMKPLYSSHPPPPKFSVFVVP